MRHATNRQHNVTLIDQQQSSNRYFSMVDKVGTTDSNTVDRCTSRMTPSQSKMRAHGAGPRSDAEFVALLIVAAGGSRKDGARNFKGCTNPDVSSIKKNTHTVFRIVAGRSFIVAKTTRKSAPSGVSETQHGRAREMHVHVHSSSRYPLLSRTENPSDVEWKTLIRSFSPTAYISDFVLFCGFGRTQGKAVPALTRRDAAAATAGARAKRSNSTYPREPKAGTCPELKLKSETPPVSLPPAFVRPRSRECLHSNALADDRAQIFAASLLAHHRVLYHWILSSS